MKMISKKTLALTCLIVVLASAAVTLAAGPYFTQQITWTHKTISFSVTGDTTVDYGPIDYSTIKTLTYTVTNTGNIAAIIYPHTGGSGFTAVWDKTSATLNPDASTTFTLTLTITGDGSCTVTFTDTA